MVGRGCGEAPTSDRRGPVRHGNTCSSLAVQVYAACLLFGPDLMAALQRGVETLKPGARVVTLRPLELESKMLELIQEVRPECLTSEALRRHVGDYQSCGSHGSQ
jgi:hypothetical protein